MLDKETKLKLEEFISKINEKDSRVYSVEIAFDEDFIYLQFEVLDKGIQEVLQISDFIDSRYSMYIVYIKISDVILKIIEREYALRLSRLLYDR